MKLIALPLNVIIFIGVIKAQLIPNQYIIQFDSDAKANSFTSNIKSIQSLIASSNNANSIGIKSSITNKILHTYSPSTLNGISAQLDDSTLERVKDLPYIAHIEQDQIVKSTNIQQKAGWNLARISQHSQVGESPYAYHYPKNAGEGVNIYLLDTGINTSHNDFNGSATWGTTTFPNSTNADLHGHGTHCAGIAIGREYGVAKNSKVIAVKVLGDDGVGSVSACIEGVNWVIKNKSGVKGNVASMSLAGGYSKAFNKAVNNAASQGIIIIAGAGNDFEDACNYSPGSAEKAITVGAIDSEDNVASFSNYGKCVDIHAPGVDIKSAWIGSNKSYRYLSGTSMATPHIAGIAATLLGQGVPAEIVESKLKAIGTKGKILGLRNDTVNLIGIMELVERLLRGLLYV
ncbi:cephalosporin C acetylhydrolase [Conidiobolus coronatus NRRL 28638]|uniref:Cephalosporin C acetylhydrolase n=1 Tax=Conidiobolus coronatus (strain ATCC 28846 / CBS 209.66 / NRRL 28638) TaxID=796925 RepID=A0A137P9T2_CONC2|nr:cephalosporin C acetylhydrolase [Conidiobolus coronatus NRRL 28638]|eukprot:KXN71753.1 cephalosporin C acetylhydrolase [Conidiobolus coronatus NRRL 28638]